MSDLYAVVIGVDRHDPSWGGDCGRIHDLAGAVSDALRMTKYLREGPLGLPDDRLRTLLSPNLFSDVAQPAEEDLATHANIERALTDLVTKAARGDQVLIHFSGHGMRVPSHEELKGAGGWDEALVPCDVGSKDGGPLRDVELYHLLSRLSDAGLYVTLVLDACHSGSATRGAGFATRGEESEDTIRVRTLGTRSGQWGPDESPLGSWSDLYRAVRNSGSEDEGPAYRHFEGESHWFPQPKGCVLLAACRADELAREKSWGAAGVGGAFTHNLLEGLDSVGPEASYSTLLRSVRQRVQAIWRSQTPILEGDGALQFLGAGRQGKAGLSPGVETRSRLQCRVGFDAGSRGAPPALADLLASGAGAAPRVELLADESGRADLCLGLVEDAAVEVRDPFGTPIAGVGEPVRLDAPDAARTVAERLEHLALYRRVRELAPPTESPLRGVLRLALFQVERKEDWNDPAARQRVQASRVPTGLLLCMLVRNTGEQALNGIVLDLRSDWAVERVHPSKNEGEFALLEPGIDHPVFLRTWLPEEVSEATSVLKVIASVDPITAEGYVLPVLGNGAGPLRSAGAGDAAVRPTAPEGDLWTTQELELTVFE